MGFNNIILSKSVTREDEKKKKKNLDVTLQVLLSHFQRIKVNHVYQESNRCANNLAKECCSLSADFVCLDGPYFAELCIILDLDAIGWYSLRLLASF